jgi:hypothetical protein
MNRPIDNPPRASLVSFLSFSLLAGLLCAGCKTPPCSEQSFAKPFDAARVAQLSHDTYKVAWEARHCARQDLRTISRNPVLLDSAPRGAGLAGPASVLDWEVVRYIDRLIRQAHWIAYDIERNPASPRCSSKASYDIVAFDATMLKARYRPNVYATYTNTLIQKLIEMTDEISSYYQLKKPEGVQPQK